MRSARIKHILSVIEVPSLIQSSVHLGVPLNIFTRPLKEGAVCTFCFRPSTWSWRTNCRASEGTAGESRRPRFSLLGGGSHGFPLRQVMVMAQNAKRSFSPQGCIQVHLADSRCRNLYPSSSCDGFPPLRSRESGGRFSALSLQAPASVDFFLFNIIRLTESVSDVSQATRSFIAQTLLPQRCFSCWPFFSYFLHHHLTL